MNPKKINYLPLLFLPIIVVMCFGLWAVNKEPVKWLTVESEPGVCDMRDIDFKNVIVHPQCFVEYIPGELLTPEEFDKRGDIQVGLVPEGTEVCTMRVRYLVPDNINYGIGGYSVNYASTVYVNGKWLFDEGKPAFALEDEQASEAFRLFSAQPVDGVIEIVIGTSAFANVDTSSVMGWYISEYENIRILNTRTIALDFIVMSCYLLLALVSMLLFFTLPSFKANGWLTLLALVWAVRTGLKGRKILLTLFPDHTWNFVFKTEIITSPLTIILLALVLHSVFTGSLPKWLMAVIVGGSAIAALAVIVLPWPTFLGHGTWSNPIIYWSLAVMLGFILFSMRRAKPTLSQAIILVGMGMIVFAFIWDEDYFRHLSLPFSITQPTMLVFTMFMLVSVMLATMQETVSQEVALMQTVEEQKRELTDARISVMLSQIQPHFLYNALTSINNLCQGNPEARKAITTFSDYLRGNMDSLNDNSLISIETELEHTRQYLWLEELRFEERLSVVYELKAGDFLIPALTIQPIVENAVRYGITKKEAGGTVTIRTEWTAQSVRITITDNGVGFDTDKPPVDDGRSHMGITSVRARLAAMCEGSLTVKSIPGEGTTAIIELPLERVII